jgi:hypothetical protein
MSGLSKQRKFQCNPGESQYYKRLQTYVQLPIKSPLIIHISRTKNVRT